MIHTETYTQRRCPIHYGNIVTANIMITVNMTISYQNSYCY